MQVDEATVRRIARLARIAVTENEVTESHKQLNQLFNLIEEMRAMHDQFLATAARVIRRLAVHPQHLSVFPSADPRKCRAHAIHGGGRNHRIEFAVMKLDGARDRRGAREVIRNTPKNVGSEALSAFNVDLIGMDVDGDDSTPTHTFEQLDGFQRDPDAAFVPVQLATPSNNAQLSVTSISARPNSR